MKKKLLGYYDYTVILTYAGMLTGFLGIACVQEGNMRAGMICLMMAGICDMFDGAVAATKKERTKDEKCFGIQIDSLSDLVCFGVLPASMLCGMDKKNDVAYAVSAMYVLGALIRLAYFNVDEQNRQKGTCERRKYYYGLPVTTIAVIFPLMFALAEFSSLKKELLGTLTLAVTGILFLVPFRIKKPDIIGKAAVVVCGVLEFAFLIVMMGDV